MSFVSLKNAYIQRFILQRIKRMVWGRRVTVDVDGVDRGHATVKALAAYYRLVNGGAVVRVDLTHHGYHLIGWFPVAVDVDYWRCFCGDDVGRIFVDSLSGGRVSEGILFGLKRGFRIREIQLI